MKSLSEGRSKSSGSDSEALLLPSRSVSAGVCRGVLVGVASPESLVSERAEEDTLRRWGEGMIMSGRWRLVPLSAESATELADISGVALATKLLQMHKLIVRCFGLNVQIFQVLYPGLVCTAALGLTGVLPPLTC